MAKKRRSIADGSIVIQAPIVGGISFGSTAELRRQKLCMFSCSLNFILPMVFFCWGLCLYFLLCTKTMVVPVILYLSYILLLDRSPMNGARRTFLRHFKNWWADSCDYLPLLLVKTFELDPKKKYVFGYHPHGIISVGCFGAFATDSARTMSLVKNDEKKGGNERGFSALFPGIDRRVITLPQNFTTPFLREYFLSMGACTSAKQTFRTILKKEGRAVVVVVGGAAESLMARKGTLDLVLEKRRGFVREAIMAGACLVPVIGFGENDLYHMYEPGEKNTWILGIQQFVKRTTGLGMPIFKGRSVFLREFGVMPQRKPVVVVVGAPIEPPKLDAERRKRFRPEIDRKTDKAQNLDGELVIEWHAKYIEALDELYTRHKDAQWNLPGRSRRESMKIVR